MADTFYFYDLETSGTNPRQDRIMQFAGQRTDLDLNPIGQPHNILIKLSEDILPDPEAILITGITPQQTQVEGITEYEFLQTFYSEIATPGTIFIGYNSVRFDDEFMRATNYRNFYDPYQWQWQDDRSRWDLLDVVRMTRALRPEGIVWPVDDEGKPTNRLELLASANKLHHANAHDALSDVLATIELARLLKTKQAKLWQYLFSVRTKDKVKALVTAGQPFVYSSGKYANETAKTTVVSMISPNARGDGALVYDLAKDPNVFADLSVEDLVAAWQWLPAEEREAKPRLPIKTLKYNRCPAVAPLGVISTDNASQVRLGVDMATIQTNLAKLQTIEHWPERLLEALAKMDKAQEQRYATTTTNVDGQIYDGFVSDADNRVMAKIRQASADQLSDFLRQCHDQRLKQLLPLYKARNFMAKLTSDEHLAWDKYRAQQLLSGGQDSRLAKYFTKLEEISNQADLSPTQQHLLADLQLWGQSIIPSDD